MDEVSRDSGGCGVFTSVLCPSEFVFYLDASDEFLKERVKNLPESLVEEQSYEQEPFLQSLAKYREDKLRNDSALHFFEETDISPIILGNQRNWILFIFKIFTLFILYLTYKTLSHQLVLSFFVMFLSSEVNSDHNSDSSLWMQKVFETLGRPRNYGAGAQDGQQQESCEGKQRMEGRGLEQGSLSLEDQGAGSSEDWVGSQSDSRNLKV